MYTENFTKYFLRWCKEVLVIFFGHCTKRANHVSKHYSFGRALLYILTQEKLVKETHYLSLLEF